MNDNSYDQQSRLGRQSNSHTFEINKGNSHQYLKELSAQKKLDLANLNKKEGGDKRVTWSPFITQNSLIHNNRDHKSDGGQDLIQSNKENYQNVINNEKKNNVQEFLQSAIKQKQKNKVTFKDDILETEKVIQNKFLATQNQQQNKQKSVSQSYPELFKNYAQKLDRYQHYSQPQYQNQEIFHENIEKSYIQNHDQSPEWNSDALQISKQAIRKNQIFIKAKFISLSFGFAVAIILLCSLFISFKTIKLFKIFVLIGAVVSLRTLVYEEQFQNVMKDLGLKDLGILASIAMIEFFCMMGFATEIYAAILPSHIQFEVFWVVPSGFLALSETIIYWRKSQQNKINEEFLNIKCNTFEILKDSLKSYFQSFQFLKDALVQAISSALIVTCCYYSKIYYHEQQLIQNQYLKKESFFNQNPFPEILLDDYYIYIICISILCKMIVSFSLNFNYELMRYSVVSYLGNYTCFQPLYTIIFKYPIAFSDFIQHEAMKYWYAYQTVPLSQVIERTQFTKNLTENENKVLDTIFEFISKEMNNTLIALTSNDQESIQKKRDITSFFIKNRKIQTLLKKQRFLQSILKFTLMIISNSAKVFNLKVVDFIQNTASTLDQLIQLFEKQGNYFTAEIADIIILKKEVVSNIQYIYTKMNSTVKSQNLSAIALSIMIDSNHIYNEYDLDSKFVC
ncbi:hypothetical protein ABPG74_013727 [Tetrahymena malaccensis]